MPASDPNTRAHLDGDPVAAKARIARANRTGERLGAAAYGDRIDEPKQLRLWQDEAA